MRYGWLVLVVLLAGCGKKPPPSTPDTGAKLATQTFFEALTANDPPRAYEVLDADSKRRVSLDQFTRLAKVYSKNLGFAAEKVYVQSCEERGESATAHVVLTGPSRRYADGTTLRNRDGRWGVVLAKNFGQPIKP